MQTYIRTNLDRRSEMEYSYSPAGKVTTVTDALNGVKTYSYDLLGRLILAENELGNQTSYVIALVFFATLANMDDGGVKIGSC